MINQTPTVCQGKCQQHSTLNYCLGCYRTMEQISNWSKYTQEEKNEILNSELPDYIKDNKKLTFVKTVIRDPSKYV